MIYCNVCLTREALVVAEGRLYCPHCYIVQGPKFSSPDLLRARSVERRKYVRELPDTAYGLLPTNYDDAQMP